MTFALRGLSLAAIAAIAFTVAPAAFAQDAMSTDAMSTDAMATDAMAPAAATPLTDDEFKLCMEQAGGITFPAAQLAAATACHGLHQGADVMGAIESLGLGEMSSPADAMAIDAMSTDAMAPATK
ncbi:hypothetical protein [Devosia ginsengisoli]|uniref:DUF732 domain-containing protein n=1 Tax=Devosia ginsengisoli TaxID=400770 RepID=A0A5B8LTF9_9HYPH|nr:hypothetical protein [Devosia ginsengisoli]QDZ11149.1 hypothetical protein FPZ08_10505 [Devosia ginsengisoli]